MPMSAEQRRALSIIKARWDKENMRQVKLKLNLHTDADVLAMLNAQDNMTDYVRRLIRADMGERRCDD